MNKGFFLTLEGGEGLGKSTNLEFVREFLEARGKRAVVTREPGGTRIGEKIRSLFLGEDGIAPETELLLVFAARAQHLRDVIEPALEAGAWVVCDRFTDATYAYQGGGRCVEGEFILSLEKLVQKGRKPDLTFLLDAPVEVGMARAKKRGPGDRFDLETVAFFERVRGAYLQLAENNPERIKIIDASLALPEVQAAISLHLQKMMEP